MKEIKTKHGHYSIGENVIIEPGVYIDVKFGIFGDRCLFRSGSRIEGNSVVLGKECYLDNYAKIGGGSCWDDDAFLTCGDWLHMGNYSQINIARGVDIGEEVGLGVQTQIFTHGAYLPIDQGFPVQWGPVFIGNRVWLPNCWVNPNVVIGDNVVVAARSLVNIDLPSGCLAGGIPVKILKQNEYPKRVKVNYAKLLEPTGVANLSFDEGVSSELGHIGRIWCGETIFEIDHRLIYGPANSDTEKVKDQLRRNGIRFKYTNRNGKYVCW